MFPETVCSRYIAEQYIKLCTVSLPAGPTNPVLPVFVRVTDSSGSSATIQWMVSSIAYTPETYVVRYGTSLDDLNMTSGALYSGPNVRMVSRIYSIELSDLQPSTTYFYRVVTYNLFDQTASGVRTFLTEECKLFFVS